MLLSDDLYPLQHEGVDFLAARRFALLGDAPRTGKTAQAVVGMDKAGARHVEIICPASALGVWPDAIERWSMGMWSWGIRSYEIATRDGVPRADSYIFDEAHYLRNGEAQRTRACLGRQSWVMKAKRVWALSGTFTPNGDPTEMWIWAKVYGLTTLSRREWLERFCEFQDTPYGPRVFRLKNAEAFRAIFAPVFLRREPALGHGKRWGTIPLVAANDEDLGADALADYIRIYDDLPPETDHIATLRRKLGLVKAGPLADFLADELEQDEEKVAIFAWHTEVLDILQAKLARFGVVRIDGAVTSGARRTTLVNAFNGRKDKRVLTAQIQAAGEANDFAAQCNNMVLAEMSWSDGQNDQVSRRLDGPKQSKDVLIRTAHVRGTIDEAINRVATRKAGMTRELYGQPLALAA